jgi:uncharacterized membrane protein YedE/YeeE
MKILPFIIGGGLAAFGDELQNWIVVFLGGIIFGIGMMYFVGAVVATVAKKQFKEFLNKETK